MCGQPRGQKHYYFLFFINGKINFNRCSFKSISKKKNLFKTNIETDGSFFLLFYFTLKSTLADVFLFYILKPILP